MQIKNRKKILAKLNKKSEDTNLSVDESPEEYAQKVFKKLLDNLYIEKLDSE